MLAQYSPDERQSFAREAAKATMDQNMKGVYRLLFEAPPTACRLAGPIARAAKNSREDV